MNRSNEMNLQPQQLQSSWWFYERMKNLEESLSKIEKTLESSKKESTTANKELMQKVEELQKLVKNLEESNKNASKFKANPKAIVRTGQFENFKIFLESGINRYKFVNSLKEVVSPNDSVEEKLFKALGMIISKAGRQGYFALSGPLLGNKISVFESKGSPNLTIFGQILKESGICDAASMNRLEVSQIISAANKKFGVVPMKRVQSRKNSLQYSFKFQNK